VDNKDEISNEISDEHELESENNMIVK